MPKPNILLISVDHWPGDLLGCAGHPTILTPTLDKLATSGVRFPNTYTSCPSCIPARRNLMTGVSPRTHGDRVFNETQRMPDLPTLPGLFVENGYQAYAVGKLHVYPQRSRIGFQEVILNEESRHHLGLTADDYELFMADQGRPGEWLADGTSVNAYIGKPSHLPDALHPTRWTAKEMCRTIHRRDPDRPAFWYMSFNHPHPPLTPPRAYWDLYPEDVIEDPAVGDWARNAADMPYAIRNRRQPTMTPRSVRLMRRGFYGLCTHIDHQLRLVMGQLREEGLLDNTAIMMVCDHGDMLGRHNLLAKGMMYDGCMKIPMFITPPKNRPDLPRGAVDDRLAELTDVMPTLCELAGIEAPDHCEGRSLLSGARRERLYGEHYEDLNRATRMVRDARHKLIWYPAGNVFQLFDLQEDPGECCNLADDPAHADVRARLTEALAAELYGSDERWVQDGALVGEPEPPTEPPFDPALWSQRGWRFM